MGFQQDSPAAEESFTSIWNSEASPAETFEAMTSILRTPEDVGCNVIKGDSLQLSPSTSSESGSITQKRKKQKTSKTSPTDMPLKEKVYMEVLSLLQKANKDEDAEDYFGKHVACTLRKIPNLYRREKVKLQIHQLLLDNLEENH